MCQGATEVEEHNGEVLSASEFVMKHIPTYTWENLGVYPTDEERVSDGIVVDEVFLWNYPIPLTLSIKPNDDMTVNVEVFRQGEQEAVYGRYLQDANDLKDILNALQTAPESTRL